MPRALAVAWIARAWAKSGQRSSAEQTIQQALHTAQRIQGDWDRARALAQTASAQAKAGRHEQALRFARGRISPAEKTMMLLAIAEMLLGVEDE